MALGLPVKWAIGMLAVMVASFAATTLDTATRLQRYVIQELATGIGFMPLTDKYAATGLALALGTVVALLSGPKPGAGGMMLWPLFGATNQLLAGLAFLVLVFYLRRRGKPVWFALLPMLVMLAMPAAAMFWNMFRADYGWVAQKKWFLVAFGIAIQGIQIWMVLEAVLMWKGAKGVYPDPDATPVLQAASADGGRSC